MVLTNRDITYVSAIFKQWITLIKQICISKLMYANDDQNGKTSNGTKFSCGNKC